MEKIAISPSKIYDVTQKSNKVLDKIVNSKYKPKSFAEQKELYKIFLKKYKQNKFFNTEVNKLLIPKVKELLKIKYE